MASKPFLDTNVLLYGFASDEPRVETARAILAQGGVTSVQVANEFIDVSRRKRRWTWEHVGAALDSLRGLLGAPLPLTDETHRLALDISARYGFRIYDSAILAAAKLAGCAQVYTEDLQDGQVIDGVRVHNPFAVR